MKEDFSKKFNGINFQFQRKHHGNSDIWYYINFDNNGKNTAFKMYRDNEGIWAMAAQILPEWVTEMQIEFNDLIEKNENNEDINSL
jgi:hypothetical protein